MNHFRDMAFAAIVAERHRQIQVEGFYADRDDGYAAGELERAARCYFRHALHGEEPADWPWDKAWWKPTTLERNFVKGAALYLAETERLQRLPETRRRTELTFSVSVQVHDIVDRLALIYRDRLDQRSWLPIASARRDGTMLWLLVDYDRELDPEADHPLTDSKYAATIGFNNFESDGEDAWKFAGWCWTHDHFTEGRGKVIGWTALGRELAPPACYRPLPSTASN